MTTSPCDLDMLGAAAQIKKGSLSPVELLDSVLARLDRTEPQLHAWVELDRDGAYQQARDAEADIAAGRYRGPMHGIPIAVKDIFDMAGLPTRCGSRQRADIAPAVTDAESVGRARAAGAVLMGKTVTQEFAAGTISPPARTPWDPSRIPGGSSGGTGSAVAAGSAIAGFGSDTGGSIRNPAAINGVAGLKPTFGTVSRRGVFPLAWSLDTVGPLAKTVADAATFFDAIAGPDPDDPGSIPGDAPNASAEIGGDIRGLRIGLLRGHFFERLEPDIARAVEAAADVLRGLGADVFDVDWKEAKLARAAAFVINRVEPCAIHWNTIRSTPELFADELRLRLEANSLYPASHYVRAHQARALVKQSMAALFGEHRLDALIAPASGGTAVPADDLFVRYPDGSAEQANLAYTRLTMPFNATGQPVVAVPCGFDGRGLPVGLQVAGRPFAEARVCRIAHAYEQAAGWTTRRPALVAD